ncbi:hypothetical protein JHK82_051064 [Glycine max]|nr:hypothetical protein JHK85_051763 [Glycine max]KAG5092286.1 hypothetical protein JHK82_051064 [Glycine max]KAG5095363.1 hypothetical protein JHK84_050951 [Glycine max]
MEAPLPGMKLMENWSMLHCRKYNNVGDIHWVVDKEVDLKEGLRVCETDFDIRDMVITARHNGDEVELYYDHKVDEQPILFEADVPEDGLGNLNPIPEVEEEGDKDDGDGNVGNDDSNGVDSTSLGTYMT